VLLEDENEDADEADDLEDLDEELLVSLAKVLLLLE
jgi:hypothetical protein